MQLALALKPDVVRKRKPATVDSESMWPVYLHDSSVDFSRPSVSAQRSNGEKRSDRSSGGLLRLEVDVATQLKCLTDSTRCAEKVLE